MDIHRGVCLLHMGPSSKLRADRHLFGVYHGVRNMALATSKRKSRTLGAELRQLAGWGPSTPSFFSLRAVNHDMTRPFVFLGGPPPKTAKARRIRVAAVVDAAHAQMRARFQERRQDLLDTDRERKAWDA